MRIALGDIAALAADCGPVPVASSYASAPFTPLTAAQSAQWDADYGKYQNCLQQSQGAPGCPPGQAFSGSFINGVWNGSCVSSTTGQVVGSPITQAGTFTPGGQTITNARQPTNYVADIPYQGHVFAVCTDDQYLNGAGVCINKCAPGSPFPCPCPPGFKWDGVNGLAGLHGCATGAVSGAVSSDSGISTPILLAGAGLAAYFLFFRHK